MVSLAIAETSYSCLDGPADKADSLRDSALWFPKIPESHLHLNETYFTGINAPAFEFRPLCYTLFGGSGVTNQSLTKISVLCRGSSVMAIDFHYDTSNIRRLGRQRLRPSAYNTSCFLIDGAQGEVIKTIKVDLDTHLANHGDVRSFLKHGRLRSFKVSAHFPFPGPRFIDLSGHTFIRPRRYLPIEDDKNIFDLRSARQSSLTR
jgi:hypothetical protein